MIEILLVVGLMLVVFALVLPSIRQAVGKGPLNEWSQQVRELTNDARIAAIDTGLIYQVRIEVDGQYFVSIPLNPDTESLSGETTDEQSGGTIPKSMGQMSETLTFRGADGEKLSSERLDGELFSSLPDQSKLGDATWSSAILFYPDGSATDMVFEIADDRQQAITVSIRGLTGATSVSTVFVSEER